MLPSYWERFMHSHRYAPDEGEGGDGDGNKDGGGGGGGNGNASKPEWADEFGEKFDAERAWNTIKTLRDAERTLKREKTQLSGKVTEYEKGQLTATEKLQKELDELKGRNEALERAQTTAIIRDAVADAARQEGAVYPEDIYRLLDSDAIEVEDGKVKNAAKLVTALKSARPALFGNSSADGQKGRQQQGADGGDMNSLIRRAAGR